MDETKVRVLADADSGLARHDRAGADAAIAAKLRALSDMPYTALGAEWRRLYRARPPKRVARNLLMLGVAWKIQENAYGGFSAATKRRLAALATTLQRDGDVTRSRVARLKPGARLLREWRGETHTVMVCEDGFEWQGARWRSLSVIARKITGVQWSGPRFFGVARKTTADADAGREAAGDA